MVFIRKLVHMALWHHFLTGIALNRQTTETTTTEKLAGRVWIWCMLTILMTPWNLTCTHLFGNVMLAFKLTTFLAACWCNAHPNLAWRSTTGVQGDTMTDLPLLLAQQPSPGGAAKIR